MPRSTLLTITPFLTGWRARLEKYPLLLAHPARFILLKRHSNRIFILSNFYHACSIMLFIYCNFGCCVVMRRDLNVMALYKCPVYTMYVCKKMEMELGKAKNLIFFVLFTFLTPAKPENFGKSNFALLIFFSYETVKHNGACCNLPSRSLLLYPLIRLQYSSISNQLPTANFKQLNYFL